MAQSRLAGESALNTGHEATARPNRPTLGTRTARPRCDPPRDHRTAHPAPIRYRQVPVVSLDSLRPQRLDLLKTGVGGNESAVFRRTSCSINEHRPTVWVEALTPTDRATVREKVADHRYPIILMLIHTNVVFLQRRSRVLRLASHPRSLHYLIRRCLGHRLGRPSTRGRYDRLRGKSLPANSLPCPVGPPGTWAATTRQSIRLSPPFYSQSASCRPRSGDAYRHSTVCPRTATEVASLVRKYDIAAEDVSPPLTFPTGHRMSYLRTTPCALR